MSKKLIAEAIGTATLVILGCGTAMLVAVTPPRAAVTYSPRWPSA